MTSDIRCQINTNSKGRQPVRFDLRFELHYNVGHPTLFPHPGKRPLATSSLRGRALTLAVRDYVKQYIIDNDLDAGSPLPTEGEIAQQLGVGRSSVREAIKALESLGIVEVRHGYGTFVREYNFDAILENLMFGIQFNVPTLQELLQIRTWLEAAAIGDATKKMTPQQFAKLDALMAEWRMRVEQHRSVADLDEQFHLSLFESLNNNSLIMLIRVFWVACHTRRNSSGTYMDQPPVHRDLASLEEHQAILDAIRDQDADRARAMLIASNRQSALWKPE